MMHPRPLFTALAAMLALSACNGRGDDGPVVVSVIGGSTAVADPNRNRLSETQRILLSAIAQGLVAFDEAGQIEPALAERWIVTDDGLSYIFRLRRAEWPNGDVVTAEDVARRLRASIARSSRNPLKPMIEAIDEIVVITPEVLEIRLKAPRPPLLDLLAQPELAMLVGAAGAGPFRISERSGSAVTLGPLLPPDIPEEELEDAILPSQSVVLRGERAAMAVARFMSGGADLVLGGRIGTLPIARAAEPRQQQLRFDAANGLFGLVVVEDEGLLAEAENRRALAMAIDRQAVTEAFSVPGWESAISILPERYRSADEPSLPAWAELGLDVRRGTASAIISRWRAGQGSETPLAPLRIAMPDTPGYTLLFALIAADWQRIGVAAERVAMTADADLRLIDAVAPADSAVWYLSMLACPIRDACDPAVANALDAVRAAPTLAERGFHLAVADRAVTETAVYIPLARPMRWSLVSPRLNRFRDNPRAVHPLGRLRNQRN